MRFLRAFLPCLFIVTLHAEAAGTPPGSVAGSIVDQATGHPVAYATLAVRKLPGGDVVERGAADAQGRFVFESIPIGEYDLEYAAVGGESHLSAPFAISGGRPSLNLGALELPASPVQMEKLRVTTSREAFYNSIDRKVYNVGRDVQSAGGSASSLLQNVPSVQVDVDGNVSLRGSENVLLLVDGKPSSLMSTTNRGDVLQQMPADTIDRIEVITNPSAKYRPDGTAGIINLVLKRQHEAGLSGLVRVNVGNANRANASVSANYNPGPFNVFGLVSVRQDDRLRFSSDVRQHVDATSGALIDTQQSTTEHMRPLSRLVQLGGDYSISPGNKFHAEASYHYLSFFRTSVLSSLAQTTGGPVTLDFDRNRTDPEWHKTIEADTRYQHTFGETGHELDVELKHEWHQELENNQYRNVFRVPALPDGLDYTRMHPTEATTTLSADYTRPFADGAKLEAGYAGDFDDYDTDFRAGFFNPALGLWQIDTNQTNRFIYKDWINAAYVTYARPIGRFGFQAGLRAEHTLVHTDQVTVNLAGRTAYSRLHPTLHLSYNLTDASQLQLNYSHRVHRPESEDLNPYPEYQDPYNLRAGNPHLQPEETHSIETGYQYHQDDTTYLAGLYFRDTYHAFTTVTRYIDTVTLLTTHENLASNRSGGLELVATTPLGPQLNLNASTNAFYSEINASNLGFNSSRSTLAWDAKLNTEWRPTRNNLIQLNVNYSAKRLTPQGYRLPTFYTNIGLRHDFPHRNLAFTVAISDLFNSLRERSVIDTPTLHDDFIRRRSARIIYAGFIYTFGTAAKKPKGMDFDSSL